MTGKLGRLVSLSIERAGRVAGILAGIMVMAMMLLIALEVISRTTMNRPIPNAVEIVAYLLVACVFLGLAYTLARGGHVKVDLVLSRLPSRLQVIINIGTTTIALVIISVLTWVSWARAWESLTRGYISETTYPMPLWPSQMMVPIGSCLLALQLLVNLGRHIALCVRRDK